MEKAKVDALIRDAESWHTANTIRSYVEAVRNSNAGQIDSPKLETWSSWALAEADKVDPIVSGRVFLPAQSG